jgi:hypothetical protein
MSERQAPWWANQPAPEMTRSERARWTDLQVLAYLWVVDNEDVVTAHEPLTTREVAAALGVSVGRAAHALRRLTGCDMVSRDEGGWFLWASGEDIRGEAGFCLSLGRAIAYPYSYTKAAA